MQVVIPAHNEANHVGALLESLREEPEAQVIVVDNASSDETGSVARAAGARVIREETRGKGNAVVAGLMRCRPGPVFVCDADVSGIAPGTIGTLHRLARDRRAPVARLSIGRPPERSPVSALTAGPLLAALGLPVLREPLGGLVMVDRDFVLDRHLPGGWGFDVALTVAALAARGEVPELPVAGVRHRRRELGDFYVEMAEEVVVALLRARGLIDWAHEDCALCGRLESGATAGRIAS